MLEHGRYAQWQISCLDPQAPKLDTATVLGGLGRVNVFVGANNSGKSRLMRLLAAQQRHRGAVPAEPGVKSALSGTWAIRKKIDELRSQTESNRLSQSVLNGPRGGQRNVSATDVLVDFWSLERLEREAGQDQEARHTELEKLGEDLADGAELQRWGSLKDQFATLAAASKRDRLLGSWHRVYVPVLRGLRPVAGGAASFAMDDRYKDRTVYDYFPVFSGQVEKWDFKRRPPLGEGQKAPDIFTGLGFYDELRKKLLGTHEDREDVRRYEQFLSKDIFDVEVTLTPRHDDDQVHIKLGDADDLPVSQLGDGLQQALILTWPLFAHERAMIFVEEPELFLHPGLLRRVMQFWLSDQHDHLIFCTTHSNHLLELSWDHEGLSVYSFEERPRGEDGRPSFRVEQRHAGDPHSLALLGVRTSSVFLVNATIWVEGLHDRGFLRAYLDYFRAAHADKAEWAPVLALKEDRHYAFVEYGGANIAHLDVAAAPNPKDAPVTTRTLCARMFLVADRDGITDAEIAAADPKGKAARLARLRGALGERQFGLLPCREIENTVPPAVLVKVVEDYGDALEMPKWDEYRDVGLGGFVDSRLADSRKRQGRYGADSETLNDKDEFRRRALERARDRSPGAFEALAPHPKDRFALLPAEVQRFVERMLRFVAEQNGVVWPVESASPSATEEA